MCLDADRARLLVLEGPAVLGWKAWCELARGHELGAIERYLSDAVVGSKRQDPSDVTAQMLLGALNTAARVIATAPDRSPARQIAGNTIERLIESLVGPARIT